MTFPLSRPRRLRQTQAIRSLVSETKFGTENLIYPLFVTEGKEQKTEISSMPDCFRLSIDLLVKEVKEAYTLGIDKIALFPVIEKDLKDEKATESYNPNNLTARTIKAIKENCPEVCVITDVALDPYTVHGHDGIVDEDGNILNDDTVEILVEMALSQAKAGADIVAPSDMMDGRVLAIRKALDESRYQGVLILSYSAKYASAFYGPFRDALSSNLKFGDKKTYQMDPGNALEAEKEILIDEEEGADLLMIKPGLAYLDILGRAKQTTRLPLVVYSVSGEYSMIKAAAQNDWLDEKKIVLETMTAFRRAGASGIITYHAKQIANWLRS